MASTFQVYKGGMRKTPRAQKSETEASSNLFRKILDDLHEKLKRPVSQHQRARGRQESRLGDRDYQSGSIGVGAQGPEGR